MKKEQYSLKEVAKILNLPVSKVRYWTEKFTQIKPIRSNPKKSSIYIKSEDLELFKTIKYLQEEEKLTLAGIEKELGKKKSKKIKKNNLIDFLYDIKKLMTDIYKEL